MKENHITCILARTCFLEIIRVHLHSKIKIIPIVRKHIFNVLIKGVGYEARQRSGASN